MAQIRAAKAQREASVQSAILRYLNSLPGCRARNNHGNAFSGSGTPDITACYRGQHIEIEVKRPGEKPKKLQLYELEKWREAGAVAVWVESLEEVKQLMEGLERVKINYCMECDSNTSNNDFCSVCGSKHIIPGINATEGDEDEEENKG